MPPTSNCGAICTVRVASDVAEHGADGVATPECSGITARVPRRRATSGRKMWIGAPMPTSVAGRWGRKEKKGIALSLPGEPVAFGNQQLGSGPARSGESGQSGPQAGCAADCGRAFRTRRRKPCRTAPRPCSREERATWLAARREASRL